MSLRCVQAARLSLASVGRHASEADRLELETHLAACPRCGEDHAALDLLRRLRDSEPPRLSPVARDRVRRAVLVDRARATVVRRRFWWPVAAGAGVTALGFAVALLVFGPRLSHPDVAAYRVVAGDLAIVVPIAGAEPGATTFRSIRGGRVILGAATADVGPATELSWRDSQRTVELARGKITFDVAHRAGQGFRVRTPRFMVEVIGTKFTVDPSGVRTERGTVRVAPMDGGPVTLVRAGEAWTVPAPAASAVDPAASGQAAPDVAPAPAAPSPSPGVAGARATPPTTIPARARGAVTAAARDADPGPARRLAEARRSLARGDADGARSAVGPLFHLSRHLAGEARLLYAESFLVEGRYTDAIDGYRVVVRDFPDLTQAENALFAIAELETEHGRADEATRALRRYLARYPNGRFADEAGERLARLGSASR